ncbi:hypothetical protein [Streptomyces sp. NPDC047000]
MSCRVTTQVARYARPLLIVLVSTSRGFMIGVITSTARITP